MGKIYNFQTFAVIFILAGTYALVFSESGFLERARFQKKRIELERRLVDLKAENEDLVAAYEFYRKGGLTKSDVMKAGYIEKGEKLIFFKGAKDDSRPRDLPGETSDAPGITMREARIMWIILSIVIFLFYLSRKSVTSRAD